MTIKERWLSPSLPANATIVDRIASCHREIGMWRRDNIPNYEIQHHDPKDKVDSLISTDLATPEQIAFATKAMRDALREKESFWQHKSRVLWQSEGDRNTKYFYALTK